MWWVTYTLWDRSLFIFYHMLDFFSVYECKIVFIIEMYTINTLFLFFLKLIIWKCPDLCIMYPLLCAEDLTYDHLAREGGTHKHTMLMLRAGLWGTSMMCGHMGAWPGLAVCAGLGVGRSQKVFLKRRCLSWVLKDCSESLGSLGTEKRLITVLTFTATIFAFTKPFRFWARGSA